MTSKYSPVTAAFGVAILVIGAGVVKLHQDNQSDPRTECRKALTDFSRLTIKAVEGNLASYNSPESRTHARNVTDNGVKILQQKCGFGS